MLTRIFSISILTFILILIDLYVFQALKVVMSGMNQTWYRSLSWAYWLLTAISIIGVFYYNFGNPYFFGKVSRTFILAGVVINYFSKLFAVLVLFVDDGRRLITWIWDQFNNPSTTAGTDADANKITRSEFLAKTALITAAVPFATMGFGILTGAHDYRIRKQTVNIPGLPKSFDGIKVGQLSDIHSGSFYNKKAVKGGVDMLLREKPDVIFFTGDLVNYESEEVSDYIDVFQKVSAPLGTFSILGNHDYGDYRSWPTLESKQQNLDNLVKAHKALGWDLLRNENRLIKVDGEEIAILGCENWGAGRFQKYGDLSSTYKNIEEIPTKILLSHDPSHWDAQVRPNYPDIGLMLSGHTHGFQFGVEIGDFKWSPSQYIYKQWAGLYSEGSQQIYVNRGFGFLGYPGRVGILPEITILELKSV
jgi:hypothetical protein